MNPFCLAFVSPMSTDTVFQDISLLPQCDQDFWYTVSRVSLASVGQKFGIHQRQVHLSPGSTQMDKFLQQLRPQTETNRNYVKAEVARTLSDNVSLKNAVPQFERPHVADVRHKNRAHVVQVSDYHPSQQLSSDLIQMTRILRAKS